MRIHWRANISGAGRILLAPLEDHSRRNFKMKLQAVDAVADAKGLVPAGCGRCQQLGAGWQVECLALPVKDDLISRHTRENRIAVSGFGKRNRRPPDFFHVVRIHPRTECPRNQLCTEAHPEDGLAVFDGAPDILDLASNEWQVIIRRHGATHDNQRISLCHEGRRAYRSVQIGVFVRNGMSVQCVANQAEAVGRRVPEYQNTHGLFAGALRDLKMAQRLRVSRDALVEGLGKPLPVVGSLQQLLFARIA